MEIRENQALTPDKKVVLINQIQDEIMRLSQSIKTKDYNSAAFILLTNTKDSLQNLLNNLLQKKGVITPNETNSALTTLEKSKKARLEESYFMGLRKGTFYLLTFGVIAVATYLLIKNNKK